MPTISERRDAFRSLHATGCFVLPNPWDIGSARYLQHLGFKALATSSAGYAFSRGLPDNAVPRDVMLAHIRELVEASDLPINADFENGFTDDPGQLAENVRLCVATGVAGLSIEDSTGRKDAPLYDIPHAVERIRAAREAIGDSGVMLVGRAECFLVGKDDLDDVIRRLVSYAEAGADCLYAPGIDTVEEVVAVVEAVAPKPVNVLISGPGGLTIAGVAEMGVRRVSVGGALARAAWGGFFRAARGLAENGSFDGFADAMPHGELNEFFRTDSGERVK
ncbi:MAG: isocitrate lyase/phosphoenolpyruvate mutase family protein [Chthoniobacterales bacterium]